MDILALVVQGFVNVVIGSIFTFVPLYFARKRIIQGISEYFGGYLTGFGNAILEDVQKNPDKYKPILMGLFNSIAKDMEKEIGKEAGKMVLPGLAGGALGQFIPRKYRWLFGLAQSFGFKLPGATEAPQGSGSTVEAEYQGT